MQRNKNSVQAIGRVDQRAKVFPRLKLIGLAVLIGSQSTALCKSLPRQDSDTFTSPIQWTPCGGDGVECGSLTVPLDYTIRAASTAAATATLALARYPATNQTARLGTLLTNPGGPGGSGVGFIHLVGKALSDLVDGRYDIVSWDPRGIGATTPRVECFASETDEDIFFENSHKYVVPATRNLSDPVDYAIYRSQVHVADSRNKGLAQLCQQRSGEGLRHVGSASTARDLERISRLLDGPNSKVNYYGFSYGSLIGSYLVNLFPTRIGKVVIDGIVDPVEWANHHSVEWLKHDSVDTEKVLRNFFQACAEAGPTRCALASPGSTTDSLANAFENLLNNLYKKPLPVLTSVRPGVLTEGLVRALAASYVARPRDWPQFAKSLAAAMQGDGGPILNERLPNFELDKTKPPTTSMAIWAVTCVDTPSFDGISEDAAFDNMMDEIVEASKIAPHFASLGIDTCQHWRARETERYTGPFNHTLNNPILVIGNTADPNTPLVNARAVKSYLGNSARLLIQDGSGHCSPAMTSLCTTLALRGHFLNNQLPPDGTVCPVDEQLFPPPAATPPTSSALLNRSLSERMSGDDFDLIQKAANLGEAIANHGSMFQGPRSFAF